MTGKELLEKLLESYRLSYDIERTYKMEDDVYDAYAKFCVTSAKYVLVKKAELWRADCFEHVFFRIVPTLETEDMERFHRQIVSYIEPQLVRGGEKCPQKDHMYTFMTVVFIAEEGVSEEAETFVRRYKYRKNYRFSIRGYSEARVLVFDRKKKRIFGSRSAKELVKGYSKAGVI